MKRTVKRDQRALVLLNKSEKEQLRKQAANRNLKNVSISTANTF